MSLNDEEIEKKIEKTVYKLEKFYKIYNIIYKLKNFFKEIKDIIFNHFLIFILFYTIFLYFIFKLC